MVGKRVGGNPREFESPILRHLTCGDVQAMLAEPDPAAKLAIYAQAIRDTQVRMAPLFVALRDASATEPDAAAIWREISSRRAANMVRLARDLAQAGGLRADLSIDEAADTIWATNSPELYVLLTADRGWSPDHYQHWLTDTWRRLLLPPEAATDGSEQPPPLPAAG